jgi:hypothetical protein
VFDDESDLIGYLLLGACTVSAGTMLFYISQRSFPNWDVPGWLYLLVAVVYMGAMLRLQMFGSDCPDPGRGILRPETMPADRAVESGLLKPLAHDV